MDKGSIESFVNTLFLLKSIGNLLGAVQAEITKSLSLENLLWLVELFPHESIKVVVEHKVLELSQLLGEQFLLNLIQDVVSLIVLEISSHVDLLLELHRVYQDVLVVVIFVG